MEVTDRFFAEIRGALPPAATSEPPPPGLRPAGVLVPLRDSGGEITVTLARRTEQVPHHKGQICFPGGSRDPGDLDLLATAMREAEEELGIRGADVEFLGAMERVPTVTGTVWRIGTKDRALKEGDRLRKGEEVMNIEVMKTENAVKSPLAGVIRELCVKVNDRVEEGQLLAVIDPGGE